MRHIVHLNLDYRSSALISEFWKELAVLKEVPPHVTLAIFENSAVSNRDKIVTIAGNFAKTTAGPDVCFASFGLFPNRDENVFFLSPVVTDQLLAMHKSFHETSEAADLKSKDLYRPGQWVPHCTLDVSHTHADAEQFTRMALGSLKKHMPLQAKFDSIEVLEVDQSVVSLSCSKLK